MDEASELDLAHADMTAAEAAGEEPARLRFFARLADAELFLLLEAAPDAGPEVGPDPGPDAAPTLRPRVFPLQDGPVVLVFDREERLAAFSGAVADYAVLPGRVIAAGLKGQGIGLGLNLGVAPSSMLLGPEAVDWLADTLSAALPDREGAGPAQARPARFLAPRDLPGGLRETLLAKLARAGGLAQAAVLAGVVYDGGRSGHLLAFLDAEAGAEAALARAVAEALVFSGVEAGELDVAFLASASASARAMARVGLRFDLPRPAAPEAAAPPAAPGTDPDRPPRLR